MSEANLIVVRHGETRWNREGRIQGFHADSPLTPHGHVQARAVAERLGRERIDVIYCSDLGRTCQTAAPIAAATGARIVHDASLRERSYGILEGRTFAEIAVEFPVAYERIRSRDPEYAVEGGESAVQFHSRIVQAMERIAAASPGKRVAVVTHGGVVGTLYRHALDIPLDAPRTYTLSNASCSHFRFASGRWALDLWCDVSHLPAPALDDT